MFSSNNRLLRVSDCCVYFHKGNLGYPQNDLGLIAKDQKMSPSVIADNILREALAGVPSRGDKAIGATLRDTLKRTIAKHIQEDRDRQAKVITRCAEIAAQEMKRG